MAQSKPNHQQYLPSEFDYIATYICCLGCLILVVIRLREPFIYKEVKRFFRCSKPKKSQYSKKAQTSWLNSAINVEYVVLILEGISAVLKHRECQSRKVSTVNDASFDLSADEDASQEQDFVTIVESDASGDRTTYRIPEVNMDTRFDPERSATSIVAGRGRT